ncbi:MAG: neutral zinc metallopeptidase [Hyphomicrobiales bacterium]|nr:neutral zinc metallopeptidase [Hyphomicrobiales bacterium]
MRLDDLPESSNVEDRRDGGGDYGGGGGIGGLPIGGGLGIGTIVVLGLLGWALGIDPSLLIGGAEVITGGHQQPHVQPAPSSQAKRGPAADDMGRFVSKVLGSTEVQWKQIFSKDGKTYRAPVLVLYRGQTRADCGGVAQSAMGPFYCPADMKIYLDTSFFDQIATRFRGCDVGSKSCQFAQAYVIAHEVGHHVQNLLQILPRATQAQRTANSKAEANHIQVQVELQADCLAGVWANHSDEQWKFIQPGDVESAMRTAAAIGDDTLQRRSQGYVVPDSFTHGTSDQRQRWFMTGLKSGAVSSCNTFAAAQL